MSKNKMKNIENIFAPLIGQILWSVRRGHGSFLTMELGNPHLRVREPMASKGNLPKVTASLARRRVYASGQWHFWIMNARWSITASEKTCNDNDKPLKVDKVLGNLDGQKLSAVSFDSKKKTLRIACDLGGVIQLQSPTHDSMGDIWSLSNSDTGSMMVCDDHWTISTHPVSQHKSGSIGIINHIINHQGK